MLSWTACCRTPFACFIHSAKWSSICSLHNIQCQFYLSYYAKVLNGNFGKPGPNNPKYSPILTCAWRRRGEKPHQTEPLKHQWPTRPAAAVLGWPRLSVRAGRWRRDHVPALRCLMHCLAVAVPKKKKPRAFLLYQISTFFKGLWIYLCLTPDFFFLPVIYYILLTWSSMDLWSVSCSQEPMSTLSS